MPPCPSCGCTLAPELGACPVCGEAREAEQGAAPAAEPEPAVVQAAPAPEQALVQAAPAPEQALVQAAPAPTPSEAPAGLPSAAELMARPPPDVEAPEAGLPGVDPELARLQARMGDARADRLLQSPWNELRLAWTGALAALVGAGSWTLGRRARARRRGPPEKLAARLGIYPDHFPRPVLEVGVDAGAGLAGFGSLFAAALLARQLRRTASTRHAPTVRRHAWVLGLGGLAAAGLALVFGL